jgi:PAS domain S-box-containing protein
VEGESADARAADLPRKASLLVFPGRTANPQGLRSLLQRWRIAGRVSVEFAASAEELRRRLARESWDAVISGLAAADDPALDALRELRARGNRTPFLMLAQTADEDSVYRARTLGNCEVLELRQLSEAALRAAITDLVGPLGSTQPPASADLAPAMLWKTDAQGEFTHFTRRWSILTGRPEEKELGRGWFEGIHPEDLAAWMEAYEDHLEGRREFHLDVRMRTATGEYGWVRHHGIPCFDAAHEFTGYVGSSFDITDLTRGNEELLRETKRLSEAKRDLEELAQNAAHDLQEPLRNLESILRRVEGASRADADALTRASLAQIRRVRALVRDIADYAHAGKGELALAVSDPAESLDWALSNLRQRIEESGAVIEVEPLPRVMADPIQLGRLFQNLVANALNFAGGEPAVIVVSGVRSGGEVQIWVRDDGIGIDAAHHSTIFSAFHRLHGEAIAGTGMGLAICRQIVSRHGGRIWVESEPGRGSSFFFSLPAA